MWLRLFATSQMEKHDFSFTVITTNEYVTIKTVCFTAVIEINHLSHWEDTLATLESYFSIL